MKANSIPIDRLRDLVRYEPDTGIFRWKIGRRGVRAGGQAGHLSPESGYWFIRVDKVLLRAHRAAWALSYGVWPAEEIDHKDRNRSNCRLDNLRLATRLQNAANGSPHPLNTSGHAGVSLTTSRKRYRAELRISRVRLHLGYFDTAEAAAAVRDEASRKYRGEFAP